MDWLRQALNAVLAASMPITTYFAFSRGHTVEKSLLSSTNDPPIVPAGYAFSIWGLIYAASFAYAIYQALPTQSHNDLLRRIGFATAAAFFLTSLWLVLARLNLIWLTVVCIFAILASLGVAFLRLTHHPEPLTFADKWLIEMPVSIFIGWITVAVFANTAAALQNSGWSSAALGETGWSVLLLLLAGILAVFITLASRGNLWYVLTVLWALIAIVAANLSSQRTSSVALLAGALALVVISAMLWSRMPGSRAEHRAAHMKQRMID